MAERKEYRPFNPEQAKAGAPYGGLWNDFEYVIDWYGDTYGTGRFRQNSSEKWCPVKFPYHRSDIVMLPLFHCQGKPVYMGDTLYDANGSAFEVELSHTQSMIDECSWGVETKMKDHELVDLIGTTASIKGSWENADSEMRNIANKILVRAIEDGDVVPMDVVKRIASFCQGIGEGAKISTDKMWNAVQDNFFGDK